MYSSISLEIRPQSLFTAFRALQPSANYSAEWSGRVWLPAADSNDLLAHIFLKFEVLQTFIIFVSSGLLHPTQQVQIQKKCVKLPLLSARAVTPDWMRSIAPWAPNIEERVKGTVTRFFASGF
jgi:hypothetical protein